MKKDEKQEYGKPNHMRTVKVKTLASILEPWEAMVEHDQIY